MFVLIFFNTTTLHFHVLFRHAYQFATPAANVLFIISQFEFSIFFSHFGILIFLYILTFFGTRGNFRVGVDIPCNVYIIISYFVTVEPVTSTGPSCVTSCRGRANRDFQSCAGCDVFVTCSNSAKYDMDCPAGLVWDDEIMRCEWQSTTCVLKGQNTTEYPPFLCTV